MQRFAFALCSTIAMTGSGLAENTTIVTQSDNGRSYAKIVQTGPKDDSPVVETRAGPGYVFIEQHCKHSRALIIQGTGRKDN